MIYFANTIKTLEKYSELLLGKYREKMVEEGYNPSDPLCSDMRFEVSCPSAGVFEVRISLADYFKFAENGRGPGKMPPEEPILKWIEWKKLIPKPMTLKSGRQVIPSTKSLAFLIRRKIGEKGTEGKHLFEKAKDEIMQEMVKAVGEALVKDFTDGLRNGTQGLPS